MPETTTTSSSETTVKAAKRTITGLMVFGGIFAVIGNEIRAAEAPGVAHKGYVTEPAKIFLGVTAGGTLLLLLANAGKPGRELATGLAVLTFLSSTLVFGGPVWDWLGGLFRNQPGGSPTGSTSSTLATTPTGAPGPLALPPANPAPSANAFRASTT